MGRGIDRGQGAPGQRNPVRQSSISFFAQCSRDIDRRGLKKILSNLGDSLKEVEMKYGSSVTVDDELEDRLLDLLSHLETAEKESPRADEIRKELGEITEKHFSQKIDFTSSHAVEQLLKLIGIGSASKGSMHSKEADRQARMRNILQSQQGELREEALIEIAKGNREILVAKAEIAGPGVKNKELPGKNKRQIFHRVDPEVLKEASLFFHQEVEKSERDIAGFVTERGFAKARDKTLSRYKKKMLHSAQLPESPLRKASYDMVLTRGGKLSLWEIKTSGHLGNKAGQGEYNRLLENTLLLSLVYPGDVNPYFACLERDRRFKSSENLPAGHSLVADNLLRGILPKGLSWVDYMKCNPYSKDRDPKKEARAALVFRNISFNSRVEKMSEEEKTARLNGSGTDFKNSFLGE